MLSAIGEYKGRVVLLTGGLGFVGSVLLEQLLRLTEVRSIYSSALVPVPVGFSSLSEYFTYSSLSCMKPSSNGSGLKLCLLPGPSICKTFTGGKGGAAREAKAQHIRS
jgi:hypothetical protein